MRKLLLAGAFALAAAAGLAATATPAAACGGCSSDRTASFDTLSVDQLWARIEARQELHIYDVNSKDRYAEGHVPGARWVAFDGVTKQDLPDATDSMLVFYCAREQCKASHGAAAAAVALGYTNVWVMPEGIRGWEAKQKPVQRADVSPASRSKQS